MLALLALAPALWRRARGVVLRIAAFAVLLLWLAGPRLVRETRETLPDIGLLVIDQTASMQVGDRARLAEAAARVDRARRRKLPDLELRTVTVAGSAATPARCCSARSSGRWPKSRAPASPASSRSPTARSTTSPTPRLAACR